MSAVSVQIVLAITPRLLLCSAVVGAVVVLIAGVAMSIISLTEITLC